MEAKFNYENDPERIGAKLMMMERNKNLDATEKKEINSYFNTFRMYCENDVIERFKKLQEKLADKKLIFKFNGSKYAVFPMDQFDRKPVTDYVLALEDVERFADEV